MVDENCIIAFICIFLIVGEVLHFFLMFISDVSFSVNSILMSFARFSVAFSLVESQKPFIYCRNWPFVM